MDRYPALRIIAPALRYIAIIIGFAGSGVSVLYLLWGPTTEWSMALVIAGIVLSVAFGFLLYVVGHFIGCFLDMEERMYAIEVNAKTSSSANPAPVATKGDGKTAVKSKPGSAGEAETRTAVKVKAGISGDSDETIAPKAKSNGNGHSDSPSAVKATRKLKVVEKA